MTRYSALLEAYYNLDKITLGLFMISAWVGGFGHLVDIITRRHARFLLPLYWTLIVLVYVGGMIFVGLSFS